ncbi:hypothetical protein H5V45_18365 [Nocardioides sp. KIGAM211]|uniref:Uncharacterized protein n=1 Tax=Nocardioides luti TaxID=2761101 RepID=A0A7X0RJI1_9ACTN|nr:hypothetical protein [Nocardioides luti]MBB6629297.1 hypothetical protein [Nocardioides luti]
MQQHREDTALVIGSTLALFVLMLAATAAVTWTAGWLGAGDDVVPPLALGGVLLGVILSVRYLVRQRPPG